MLTLFPVVALGMASALLRIPGGRALEVLRQWLRHLLAGPEDPVQALDQAYLRQLQSLQQVRRGVAQVVVAGRRLELHASELEQSQERLRDEARLALREGREDLARLVLTRSQEARSELASLERQVERLKQQEQDLEVTSRRLEARVESFRSQRDTVRAQLSAAQASAAIGEAVTGISGDLGRVRLLLERAREEAAQMEARAAAIEELVRRGTLAGPGNMGEADLARPPTGGPGEPAVDSELRRLRRELTADSGAGARLSAGGTETSEPSNGG